jgi:hypothetical protein
MEFAIQWRADNGHPTSAFVAAPGGKAPKAVAKKTTRKTPSKRVIR